MERSDDPLPIGRDESDPSPAALRLAAALAERLDAVVPLPLRVRAEGAWVWVYDGETPYSGTGVAGMLDQPVDPDEDDAQLSVRGRAAGVAWNALSGVQDAVAEITTEPWPELPGGGMAMPGTRADADLVFLWYGPDHASSLGAALELPPISLAELAGAG